MNKKGVQWLYQELPELVNKGVLAQSAADKLHEHYGDSKGLDKKWFIIILCGVLGAILIGLGIILLFAHNWEKLSRGTRTVLSLLPLIIAQALAAWVMFKRPKSHAFREGAATFLSLMVGSSIALISQTYNIPGDTPVFIMTWMLLIVPLVYLMKATIPAVIFVIGIAAWVGHFWNEPLTAFLFWPLLLIVIPHFLWSLRQQQYTVRATILAVVMAIGVCVAAQMTLGKAWPGSGIVIFSSLAALFYLLGACEFKGISTNWQKPFQVLGGLGIFIAMLSLTSRAAWESIKSNYYGSRYEVFSWAAMPDNLLTFLLVGSAILLFFQYVKRQDWIRASFGALPLLALIGYAFGGSAPGFSMLLFNVFLLSVSIFHFMTGIRTNNLGMINRGMIMLSALVVARFFDSEINFILKGLVFIAIGIGFLVANVTILRRKGGAA
ncbi:MAG: DUF2157 domain-containing protein [Candidatus Omnitrophota bacterium]